VAGLKIAKMTLRSLFRKPATQMYPIKPREWKERTRGHIEIAIKDCILCGICSRKCPTDAITVDREARTWTIRRMGCIQCSCCVEVCPKKCLVNKAGYTEPDTTKAEASFVKPPDAPKEEPKAETADKSADAKKKPAKAKAKPKTAKPKAEKAEETETEDA